MMTKSVGDNMVELLGKSKQELRAFCAGLGEPAYRGGQIYHALYAERKFDFARMTNLPAALRDRLAKDAGITLPEVKQRFASSDGSLRYLFELGAEEKRCNTEETEKQSTGEAEKRGQGAGEKIRRPQTPAAVEAVFMPSEGRQTICISTQAGCAVDCHFCLTARLGLIRNLTAGEIVGQVLLALAEPGNEAIGSVRGKEEDALSKPSATPALDAIQTNVVLMGQGEPLLNFEPVMAALRILLDAEGVGLSPKHVTLSTSGVAPGIERLAKESVRPKLAISLNASSDEQRETLMPINKRYPLKVLMEALRNYPLRPWEHLTFEYVMLGDVNDSAEDARRVVRLLAPLKRVKVNLIPWNPGELPYRESSPERLAAFRRVLTDKGVPAFVRYSRGRDVMAACGQLALLDVSSQSGLVSIAPRPATSAYRCE
jgi:23S rRNA (adenine2503-C2)-methyltransferase